ncbi:hypothetical protein LT493_33120 [Streptomyces tricolor]|nr:hypothetical protein [Streptomyces tricolor]
MEPRNALVKQYQRLFELDGVELDFEREALEAIADQAILRQTGARGPARHHGGGPQGVMYEVPSRKDVARVVITADVVPPNVNPTPDSAGCAGEGLGGAEDGVAATTKGPRSADRGPFIGAAVRVRRPRRAPPCGTWRSARRRPPGRCCGPPRGWRCPSA